MKIRTKLIVNYSVLSVILLLLFSIVVVVFYINYRQQDFESRLRNRTNSSVNMLFNETSIDSIMLRLIDKNIITAMGNFRLNIYDTNNNLFYSNVDASNITNPFQDNSRKNSFFIYFSSGINAIEYEHTHHGNKYKVVASAMDIQGIDELKNLSYILIWVMIFSLLMIVGFGFYNANWSLKPFRKIIDEVENIDPTKLKKRLSDSGSDELSQLSHTLNTLLDRIKNAFETEKSFIANASHELRTPVTSVLGQIEVALNKTRNETEYQSILKSVYDDTSQMAIIINGFLSLAETNLDDYKLEINTIEIDDLIFSIINDFKNTKPYYNISVEFATNPESESQIQCSGNERLLKLMFSNLIDNACKYSNDKKAKVKIDFTKYTINVSVIDYGIGIPKEDLENIFKPLYRSYNVSGQSGHGIGLAIVKRIAELHNASISIDSNVNIGTNVTVIMQSIYD